MNDNVIILHHNDSSKYLVSELCREYIECYGEDPIKNKKLTIYSSNNLGREVLTSFPYKNYGLTVEEFGDYRGMITFPEDINCSHFSIILSDSTDDLQLYSTVYHELTHVYDYCNYFNHYGNVLLNLEKEKEFSYFDEFYIWTEFNAKRIGLLRFNREVVRMGLELNYGDQAKILLNDLRNTKVNLKSLYGIVHFYARLSLLDAPNLEHIITKAYPRAVIIGKFGKDIENLYYLLLRTTTFSEFMENKFLIRYYMNSIFQ